jgi:hypothetical protein
MRHIVDLPAAARSIATDDAILACRAEHREPADGGECGTRGAFLTAEDRIAMGATGSHKESPMRTQRWIQRAIPLAAAALVGATPTVFAQWGQTQGQGQELFEWSGRVDREVQIVMRGNQISTRNVGGSETGRARTRVVSAMPRQDGLVVAQVENGRGSVDVIQQPSAQNGYTTIVRIVDPAGGAENYRVIGYWQNYSNGDYIGNSNRGRGRGRDRDRDRDEDRNGGYGNRDRNGGYGQNQAILRWSGNVDGELEIRIQNGRISYRNLSGAQPTGVRADNGNTSMPRSDSQVYIAQAQGRGSVNVVQQPSAYNGYTTVVRVRDPQGGYGFYNFDLMWR